MAIDSSMTNTNLDVKIKELYEEVRKNNEKITKETIINNRCMKTSESIKKSFGGEIPPLIFKGKILE